MKKIIFFTLLIGFIGCISDNKKTKVKTIAVVNLMAHPILDDVQKGLLDELAKAGYADNDSTRIIIKNASGQTNLIPSIINDVKLANPDLVIAITTPVAQEFKGKVKCPIVFAAVTDPVGAGLVNDLNVAEENITGSSDRTDIEANIRLIRQIHPKATRLGLLFNPAEAASQYGLRETQKYAPKYGFTLVEGVVNSTAEMYPVVNSIINKVDVMFISTDNTVAAAIPAAIRLSFDKKIPLYAFDEGSVKKGAIASISINYEAIGNISGQLAIKTMKGNVKQPVCVSSASRLVLNNFSVKQVGINIQDSIMQNVKVKYENINQN